MTREEVIWRWLAMSKNDRAQAVRRMLEDGRVGVGPELELLPDGDDFVARISDTDCVTHPEQPTSGD